MTSKIELGLLETVNARKAWPDESTYFTPWLAESKNLALLAKTLNIEELETSSTEASVGASVPTSSAPTRLRVQRC